MITSDHVNIAKQRLKIFHTFEDEHIEQLLKESYEDIKNRCQEFDMDDNYTGATLVYERTRYAYNDALEYFHENFLGPITSFSLDNLKEEDYESDV